MARLLPPARLAAIVRRWEANMDARCTVLPQRQARSAVGAATEIEYPEPGETGLVQLPCRLQPGSAPAEAVMADQERARTWWTVQLPVRARVTPTDRLWIEGTDAAGGAYTRLLEIAGPQGPRTWEAVRTVLCWEILPAGEIEVDP